MPLVSNFFASSPCDPEPPDSVYKISRFSTSSELCPLPPSLFPVHVRILCAICVIHIQHSRVLIRSELLIAWAALHHKLACSSQAIQSALCSIGEGRMRIVLTHKNNPCSYGLGRDQRHSGKNLFPRGIRLWRLLEQAYRQCYHRSRYILPEKYARGRTNDQLRELQSFRGCSLWLSHPGRSYTGWNSRRTIG